MLPNTEDLKAMFLKDVALLHQRIQCFIDETYKTAEDAAIHMFSEADMLNSTEQSILILKDCRQKLAAVAAGIPHAFSLKLSELQFTPTTVKISPTPVTYGIPYLVNFLHGTPTRFWLQLKDSCVTEIQESLLRFYSNAKPLNCIPALGSYVVCEQAEKYCRGKVVTTCETQAIFPEVKLMLVDIGEEATVTPNKIFKIEKEFCNKPSQGLLCSLCDIKPTKGDWCIEVIVPFVGLCENLVAIFHPPTSDQREPFSEFEVDYYVTLQSMKSGKTLNIGSELISKGFALSTTKQSVIASNAASTLQNSKTMSGHSASSIQNSDISHKNSKCEEALSLSNQPSQLQEPVSASTPRNQTPVPPISIHSDQNLNTTLKSSKTSKSYQSQNIQKSADGSTPRDLTATHQEHIASTQALNTIPKSTSSKKASLAQGDTKVYVQPAEQEQGVDEILDAPPAIGEDPNCIMARPADELIMKRFLSSLPVTAAPSTTDLDDSFVTARSGPRNLGSVETRSSDWESLPHSKYLEYEYGAALQPRMMPEIDESLENYIKFTISQIYTPNHFYVLQDDDYLLLQDLTEYLKETYENTQPVHVLQPNVGSFWVTQSEIQESWARAVVVKADEYGAVKSEANLENVCYVFLVDWGVFETVRVSSLRPLVKDIVDIPCTALRCHLAGIFPYLGSSQSDDWSEEATAKFKGLVQSQAIESTGLIDPGGIKNGSVSLILFDENPEETLSINEQLVNLRLASSDVFQAIEVATEPAEAAPDEGLNDWDPMKEDYYSPKNTLGLDPENYDSVAEGYVPKDEMTVCRFFRAQGFCRKGIRCNQSHIQPNPNSFTEDKTLVYVDVPSMPELPIGAMVSVQVTCVSNAYHFYAILPYGTKDLRTTFSVPDDEENLEQLQIELQKEYNQAQHKHRCTIDPAAGDIIIARSPEDNNWYRGKVIEENHNGYLNIFFVDYGNRQEVHLNNICKPLPRFMHLPAQAVEMYLNGIERSNESRSSAAKNALIRLVKERDLVAKILFDVPYVCVDLYDTTGKEQIDIAAYLVKEKLVRPAPKMGFGTRSFGKMVAG